MKHGEKKGITLPTSKALRRIYSGDVEGIDYVFLHTVNGKDYVARRSNRVAEYDMDMFYQNPKNPRLVAYEGVADGNGYTKYIDGERHYGEDGSVIESLRTESFVNTENDIMTETKSIHHIFDLKNGTMQVRLKDSFYTDENGDGSIESEEEGEFELPYHGELDIDYDTLVALNHQMDKGDKFLDVECVMVPTGECSFDVYKSNNKVLSIVCTEHDLKNSIRKFMVTNETDTFNIAYSYLLGEIIYDSRPRVYHLKPESDDMTSLTIKRYDDLCTFKVSTEVLMATDIRSSEEE